MAMVSRTATSRRSVEALTCSVASTTDNRRWPRQTKGRGQTLGQERRREGYVDVWALPNDPHSVSEMIE